MTSPISGSTLVC